MRMTQMLRAVLFLVVMVISIAGALSVDTEIQFTYKNPSDNYVIATGFTNDTVNTTLPGTILNLFLNSKDSRFAVLVPQLNVTNYPEINLSVYNSSKSGLNSTLYIGTKKYSVKDAFAFSIDTNLGKTMTVKFRTTGRNIKTPKILKAPFNFTTLSTNQSGAVLLTTYKDSNYAWVLVNNFSNFILTDESSVSGGGGSGGGGGGSSGGGSSGGTGGSYGSVAPSGLTEEQEFSYASQNSPISMLLNNSEIAITQIRIEVVRELTDVTISVGKATSIPLSVSQPGGSVYQYDKVGYTNIQNSDISAVEITFRIKDTWFAENNADKDNVALMAYDVGWKQLAATRVSYDGSYYYYQARAEGLTSLYSVVAMKMGSAMEAITAQPVEPITKPGPTPPPETSALSEGQFDILWIIIPFLLVIVLFGLGFGIYRFMENRYELPAETEEALQATKPVFVPPPQPKIDISKVPPKIAPENVTGSQKKLLQKYAFHALSKGYTEEQIAVRLMAKGWPKETVDEVIGQHEDVIEEKPAWLSEIIPTVKRLLEKGYPREKITEVLKAKGWSNPQIEEIFRNL